MRPESNRERVKRVRKPRLETRVNWRRRRAGRRRRARSRRSNRPASRRRRRPGLEAPTGGSFFRAFLAPKAKYLLRRRVFRQSPSSFAVGLSLRVPYFFHFEFFPPLILNLVAEF